MHLLLLEFSITQKSVFPAADHKFNREAQARPNNTVRQLWAAKSAKMCRNQHKCIETVQKQPKTHAWKHSKMVSKSFFWVWDGFREGPRKVPESPRRSPKKSGPNLSIFGGHWLENEGPRKVPRKVRRKVPESPRKVPEGPRRSPESLWTK